MNEMTVKVEFFSDKKNLDLIHNCLVWDRAPREIFNSYCWGSVYCKHHFSKIICSKGVCRNVKWGKKLSRESFLKALKWSNQQKNLLENKKNNGSVRSQCKSIDKAMANNSERGLGFDDPKISNGDLMKFIQGKIKRKYKYRISNKFFDKFFNIEKKKNIV